MRIVLFGSGGAFPVEALRALARRHEIAAAVQPSNVPVWRQNLRRLVSRTGLVACDEFSGLAWKSGAIYTIVRSRDDAALTDMLSRVKPDLLCIATFPWLLPEQIVRAAKLGALNLHSSLLPRHRGRNPWFWVYHSDDRETGVTVHYAVARADAGAILGQTRFPLPRGFPIERLYLDCARSGAQLLAECVNALADGTATAIPQDEARATRAPGVKPGSRMIDFHTWPAERVWHFLAGMHSQYREPFEDSRGKPIRYCVLNYENAGQPGTRAELGSLQEVSGGWRLQCRDGVVNLGTESS